jgi:hypothetical protein
MHLWMKFVVVVCYESEKPCCLLKDGIPVMNLGYDRVLEIVEMY